MVGVVFMNYMFAPIYANGDYNFRTSDYQYLTALTKKKQFTTQPYLKYHKVNYGVKATRLRRKDDVSTAYKHHKYGVLMALTRRIYNSGKAYEDITTAVCDSPNHLFFSKTQVSKTPFFSKVS